MTTECSAAEGLPASLHDMREPGHSRSNTRTGRDRACIETGGQVRRHHNLLPSFLGRRSFAAPLSKGMIEYDHRDQIPAFLLPSSHSRPKFIEGRWHFTVAATDVVGRFHVSRHCLKSTVLRRKRTSDLRVNEYIPQSAGCRKNSRARRLAPQIDRKTIQLDNGSCRAARR